MIWRDQIILDLEDGPLILYTFYGYNNKKFRETLDYLFGFCQVCGGYVNEK